MFPKALDSRGAYGFRLIYADPGPHLRDLVEVDVSAPAVAVSWRHAIPIMNFKEVDENHVTWATRGRSALHVEREPRSIRFDLPEPPVPAALVHPFLTFAISILTRWRGDVTLHAGAFETPSGAWGIMGARKSGKSAMLAALAERGFAVVADDLLAIQDGSVWAGPNCVDLRPDTADHFSSARYLGVIGGRPRFRLSTPPSRAQISLRGFFVLDWHERPVIEAELVPAEERLQWLYRQEYLLLLGRPDPRKVFRLMSLPTWRIRRPSDWGATQDAVNQVLAVTAGQT